MSSAQWHAVPYTHTDQPTWDAIVARSRVPHFLFYRDYMDYHADRFRDASLLLWVGERLAAILPASRSGDTVSSHAGLTFGGVISDDSMTAHGMLQAFDAALAHYRGAGATRLVYAPIPHIYHAIPAEEDLYALFRSGARLARRDLASAIDLARRPRATKGRRAASKLAASNGVEVRQSFDFGSFMTFEAEVLEERYGVTPTHSGQELALLAQRFPESIQLFVAIHEDRLIAGIVTYVTERVAHAQYIGASEDGRRIGGVDAIVEHLLASVYSGKRYFDFGISTEDGGRRLNSGLIRNKESYGGRAVAYDRYELRL